MIYGMTRVSTPQQNIERQVRNILAKFPTAAILKEIHTRTSFEGRKEWNKLMKVIKSGDTIVFDSVSRMSGNADEGCEIYEQLFNQGIELVFLNEPSIDTAVYRQTLKTQIQLQISTGNAATDNLITAIIEALNQYTIELAKQQIRVAFEQSQKEVEDLHIRTKEGIQTARLNGKQIGQKKGAKLTTKKSIEMKQKILKYSKDFSGSLNDSDCIQLLGIARNSFYKYKKELKQA